MTRPSFVTRPCVDPCHLDRHAALLVAPHLRERVDRRRVVAKQSTHVLGHAGRVAHAESAVAHVSPVVGGRDHPQGDGSDLRGRALGSAARWAIDVSAVWQALGRCPRRHRVARRPSRSRALGLFGAFSLLGAGRVPLLGDADPLGRAWRFHPATHVFGVPQCGHRVRLRLRGEVHPGVRQLVPARAAPRPEDAHADEALAHRLWDN